MTFPGVSDIQVISLIQNIGNRPSIRRANWITILSFNGRQIPSLIRAADLFRSTETQTAKMQTKSSGKKIVLAAIKIGVSVGIIAWLYSLQKKEIAEIALREKNWLWLVLAFLFCLSAHVISFLRWKLLVRALDIPFSAWDAVRIGFIGLFFGLFAFGVVGSDSLRVFYAARQSKNRLAEVFCTVFADRAIGMLTMFTFATIGFFVIGLDFARDGSEAAKLAIGWLIAIVVAATAIGWLVSILFLFSAGIEKSRLVAWLKQLPKIGGNFARLADVVVLYRHQLPTLLSCFGMSMLVNLCFVATIFLTAQGLNVEHPTLLQHFVIAPITMAANAVPLPGGMGSMEAMLAFLYDTLSTKTVEAANGIAVAFAFRFALLALAVIGALAWFANRRQIAKIVGHDAVAA